MSVALFDSVTISEWEITMEVSFEKEWYVSGCGRFVTHQDDRRSLPECCDYEHLTTQELKARYPVLYAEVTEEPTQTTEQFRHSLEHDNIPF